MGVVLGPRDSRYLLTPSTPANESQIIEFGNLVLHHSGAVPKFRAAVLVIPGPDGNDSSIGDVAESNHLEGHGEGFVGPPVSRKGRAQEVRTSGPDQFAWILRLDLVDDVLGPPEVLGSLEA